jgi:hypothetical protein
MLGEWQSATMLVCFSEGDKIGMDLGCVKVNE